LKRNSAIVSAWYGGTYGIRINKKDRDRLFNPGWDTVKLYLDGERCIEVSVFNSFFTLLEDRKISLKSKIQRIHNVQEFKLKERFDKVGTVLMRTLSLIRDLEEEPFSLMVNSLIENEVNQDFTFALTDYAFVTPVYRCLQWLPFPDDLSPEDIIHCLQTLRKEYLYAWSLLLELLSSDKYTKLLRDIVGTVWHDRKFQDIDEAALTYLKGMASELKACYVLVDFRKAFLPLALMQAPITPWPFIGAVSGDVYLFDENLIIDIKSGWLNEEGLPTYYIRRGGKTLSLKTDLRKISDMERLYGVRKGIGVVAQDGKMKIHLAIYVPWKGPTSPLLHLTSIKPPILFMAHRNFSPLQVIAEEGKDLITIQALKTYDAIYKLHSKITIKIDEIRLTGMDKNGKRYTELIDKEYYKVVNKEVKDFVTSVKLEIDKSIIDKIKNCSKYRYVLNLNVSSSVIPDENYKCTLFTETREKPEN